MKRIIFIVLIISIIHFAASGFNDKESVCYNENSSINLSDRNKTYQIKDVTFMMAYVEGGSFMMGATVEQGGRCEEDEYPPHDVILSSFFIGQTEVTQALWQAVMGDNPSYFADNPQRPVEMVSWYDCQRFITKLNQLTGEHFRLPTEAEWEFAARGGSLSKGFRYSGSNKIDDVAWFWGNIPSQYSDSDDYGTQPVGTKLPNELLLYDLNGNVWEWCQDWYDFYDLSIKNNPTGPDSGLYHIYRGGCWIDDDFRVSIRGYDESPSYKSSYVGFRLAL